MSSSRAEIIGRLRANQEVDEWADLCIYPSGSMFVVEFFPPSGSLDNSGLTEQQTEQLRDEGELSEYFETPEEAAELYLLLESHYRDRLLPKKVAFGQESDTPRKSASSKKRIQLPTLDADTFENAITTATEPVVVLFWSPWSGPDRLLLPMINGLSTAYSEVRFFTLDIDESSEIVAGLRVQQTPACLVFRDGRIRARIEGTVTEDLLRRAILKLLGT
ncbi:MAG: thioredoxin [Planctomycetia bacterium]|nr:thioredoxin [Planctomycetia bacterium]